MSRLEANVPTLTIQRPYRWLDKARRYRIFLDGADIGRIGTGGVIRQEITSGLHVIEAKIDWCGSEPLRFSAQSEDMVAVVRSGLHGWRVLSGLFYVFFMRRKYLTVELVEPPPT